LLFAIGCFTAIGLFTVGLRSVNNQSVYRLYKLKAEQDRLKQQLGGKQLRLESRTNPQSVSEQLEPTEGGPAAGQKNKIQNSKLKTQN